MNEEDSCCQSSLCLLLTQVMSPFNTTPMTTLEKRQTKKTLVTDLFIHLSLMLCNLSN